MLAEIPFPSLPMIKANLPAVFHWCDGVPFMSVPKIQKPLPFSLSKVWLRLVSTRNGNVSHCSSRSFDTTGLPLTARCLGMMTPETLVASAVRKMEPRLCGSVKPSRINKRGFSLGCLFQNRCQVV